MTNKNKQETFIDKKTVLNSIISALSKNDSFSKPIFVNQKSFSKK